MPQELGQEKSVTFIAGVFRGTKYFQYNYRHTDGELFFCGRKSHHNSKRKRPI